MIHELARLSGVLPAVTYRIFHRDLPATTDEYHLMILSILITPCKFNIPVFVSVINCANSYIEITVSHELQTVVASVRSFLYSSKMLLAYDVYQYDDVVIVLRKSFEGRNGLTKSFKRRRVLGHKHS